MTQPTKQQLESYRSASWIDRLMWRNPLAAVCMLAVIALYIDQRANTEKLIELVQTNIRVNTELSQQVSKAHDHVGTMKDTISDMTKSLRNIETSLTKIQ